MDNLNSHKVVGVREAIAARGALLAYLPPYSPDLNPIEPVFAQVKGLLRGPGPRTVGGPRAAPSSTDVPPAKSELLPTLRVSTLHRFVERSCHVARPDHQD